jgi:methionyl-tRNA synthetase
LIVALFSGDPERAACVLNTSVNLVALAARLAFAFIPGAATRVLEALGEASPVPAWPRSAGEALGVIAGGRKLKPLPVLFAKLSAEWVEAREQEFAGV